MLITAPFWITATVAETYGRVATLMFWGLLAPAMEFEPLPVETRKPNPPEIAPPLPLPLAA